MASAAGVAEDSRTPPTLAELSGRLRELAGTDFGVAGAPAGRMAPASRPRLSSSGVA
ncbi:hypothetical protein FHR81_004624 [Actinoalloteichus hoggarensis]|uniref:Uncharacterized protein n=1 Tax=Actinoalloteichus hoggarensis TaxID=1470176 RepID=A0A221W487_9PSEU|nr:hypothetical protein AHOG_14355 [Actinoalloteichus hoggarensis]MBB5923553.1 hypothetical protein [Actinoalloteichus hoggarensis]